MKREAMLNVRGPGQGEDFFSGGQKVLANGGGLGGEMASKDLFWPLRSL